MNVLKRCGKKEHIDLEKIHRVLTWASNGLINISVSEVELKAQIQFFDGISTKDIHKTLIKSAADLISESSPDYQYLAARLAVFNLRKLAYGKYTPPHLLEHVKNITNKGHYDRHILEDYSEAEFDELNKHIDHERDISLTYAAVKQFEGKYLVKNRVTNKVYETPQFLYMLISMCLFRSEKQNERLNLIKRFYNALSSFKISLPTPILAGVRTPTRQFSSCVLIDCDDTLDSISASATAIIKYVSKRAGIGLNIGSIRALGSEIKNGQVKHTGIIPFLKFHQAAVKSCSQGGVRGGAATVFYPLWHLECESLLVLKNNRGVEENRARHMDYGVQINKLMYQRLLKKGNITLFSPHNTPGLYESFFSDQDKFESLYTAYEKDPSIHKKQVKAIDLFSTLLMERSSTGRIYIQNVDHCNTHSPFIAEIAPIKQSNLCMEIALPTKPLQDINDETGEIALCTLSAFNLGKINLDELEDLSLLITRALDSLLDYQDYPVPCAKNASINRRTLGIGVINFANYLAKNGVRYSDGSANNLTHRTFEALQYNLLKASISLAKEKGPCPLFKETTYSKGLLPIDTYKKEVDKICSEKLMCNWEELRRDIAKYGLRHSTLTAIMPCETSSQISNATNGIEPPRGFISVKASKDGILKQVVPDYEKLKNNYELLWDLPNNKGYIELAAIMQKFIDQAISANTNYDPSKYSNGKISMNDLILDLLQAYRLGIKTLYYHNTRDGSLDKQEDIKTEGDDSCSSCIL